MSDYQEAYQKTTPTNRESQTSVASRDKLDRSGRARRYKAMIFDHICLYGHHGATCDEIEQRLNIIHQTASCYIRVLAMEGQIEASGQTRESRFGRKVTVWTRKFRPTTTQSAATPVKQDDLFQVKPSFKREDFV